MWVFSSRLPENMLMIAPRGLYAAKNGYSWHPYVRGKWPSIQDFQPGAEKIFNTITEKNFPQADFSRLHLIGFSQGTAFAYSISILFPERITSVAGLSGFIPENASTWLTPERIIGLPIFIAHGTKDDLVPIEKARQSVELLEKAGADVIYCEDDVGHKLSLKCFHGLEAFYQHMKC